MADEMVIFTRTFDFITWLVPQTQHFPRSHRFGVTKRLQDAALDFYEALIEANALSGDARLARLRDADTALVKTRHYLRLTTRWEWLSGGGYRHAAGMVAELGRLLGGWIRQTAGSRHPSADRRGGPKGAGVAGRRVQQQ